MFKKIILHIGAEKTGSTALQEGLVKNQILLHEKGVAILSDSCGANNREFSSFFMSDNRLDDYYKARNVTDMRQSSS